jgi:hypothetical protein
MEPLDIWRSAKVMVAKHDILAPQECRRRAEEMSSYGDEEAESAWEAIARAAESLLENGPPIDIDNA